MADSVGLGCDPVADGLSGGRGAPGSCAVMSCCSRLQVKHSFQGFEAIGLAGRLVPAQAMDAGKPHGRERAMMPRPRVVGMRMGDERAVDRPQRIDVKSAGPTPQPGGRAHQQLFRTHGRHIGMDLPNSNPLPAMTASAALPISSGDLIADRRYAIASELERRGEFLAAADVLAQALERAPGFSIAWFALGDVRERLDDRGGAVAAFRRARALDPNDAQGAGL